MWCPEDIIFHILVATLMYVSYKWGNIRAEIIMLINLSIIPWAISNILHIILIVIILKYYTYLKSKL